MSKDRYRKERFLKIRQTLTMISYYEHFHVQEPWAAERLEVYRQKLNSYRNKDLSFRRKLR